MYNTKKTLIKIPLSVPHVIGNEWTYVKECLDSGWVSSAGKYVEKFEQECCNYIGSKYAIACVNGSSALHVSLLLSGVKPDEEVIVPTLTFIAPINVVIYIGAKPVFMDCDDYYNINVEKVENFLKHNTYQKNGFTFNKLTKKRIAAIIPVHVFGNAVDMENLLTICSDYNIKVIEDATESLGTTYNSGQFVNRRAGNIGQIGCLSFNGNKIITTGGGGMILTNNPEYADKARYLTTQAKDDVIKYIHNEIGFNYRLTNIQAAMGVAQLENILDFIKIKKQNYNAYKISIDKIQGLKLTEVPKYADNNHWMYALQINEKIYGQNSQQLMTLLLNNNIETRPIWYLNHLQKPFKDCQTHYIEKAYKMWETTINIPCSVSLKTEEMNKVISVLNHE
jgi:aminotransferase in exopolysaccharide biosynthesis